MSEPTILAIDNGTQSVRALLVNTSPLALKVTISTGR